MHDHQEGKLDLVPMIDCIMLLLLFFLLTSSFTSPEGVLASLLPPNGQGEPGKPSTAPPRTIAVVALPDHLGTGQDADDWQQRWNRNREQSVIGDALVRVGGAEPFRIQGRLLGRRGETAQQHLDALHAYIRSALEDREQAGKARPDQYPVEIHCFSGLPWKVTMVVYDAVRGYELERQPELKEPKPEVMARARSVAFAAPPIRNVQTAPAGWELMALATRR